jgi:hypothetical protein
LLKFNSALAWFRDGRAELALFKTNFTKCGHTVYGYKTTLYRLYNPNSRSWQGGLSMARDGTDVMETGGGIARREFRSKRSAGNEAVARIRGRFHVAKLLLS